MTAGYKGLTKQVVQIPLTGGIDRKTDKHQLSIGQMYTADNVQYTSERQVSKRNGYQTLNPPGNLQGVPFVAVGCRDDVEPLVLGNGTLNRYNVQTNLSTYIPAPTQGRLSTQVATASSGQTPLATPPSGAAYASDNNSYVCIAWLEPGLTPFSFFYGLQDMVTGNWILSPKQVIVPQATFTTGGVTYNTTNISGLRVVYNAGYFYFFYTLNGSGPGAANGAQVFAYGLNTFNGQAGVFLTNFVYTLYSNSNVGSALPIFLYDAAQLNGLIYFGAATNPFGNVQLTAYSVDGLNFTSTASQTLASGQTSQSTMSSVSLAVSNNNQAIAVGTPGYLYRVSVPTLTYQKTATANGDVNYAQVVFWVGSRLFTFNAGAFQSRVRLYGASYDASMTLQTNIISEGISTVGLSNILTTPFYANGYIYIWVFTQGYGSAVPYRSQVLLQIEPNTGATLIAARTSYQTAVYTNIKTQALAAPIIQIPGTNQFMAFLAQSTIIQDKNRSYGTLSRVVFDVTPKRLPTIYSLPAGGNFIAGAFPLHYDGQTLFEAGFTNAPDFGTGVDSIAAPPVLIQTGGAIGAGTYSWYVCFAHYDAYGNILRSAPSTAFTMKLPANANQMKFPAISYYNKPNVFIEYYRTTVATPLQPYYVGRTTNGGTFTDTLADADISGNPTLYSFAGEVPNDPPPAVHHMAIGEARAYIIPADNRNSIWLSKTYTPGRSVEWTSNNILTEGGTHSGQFTAVGILDTNVIVFKKDQVLYFYGTGPDNAGNGGPSAFQRLSSDVGCVDPGSIVNVPAGLLFRSQRGIELLTRGLQVQYIGAPIEPIVQAIDTISSACVLPQYQQVRFVSSAPNDPVLVFDYMHNRWSTYSGMAARSCANVKGNYWWISQDGATCNIETPGQFSDNGAQIYMTLETPEIGLAGLQGWGRAYRMAILGDFKSSHALFVSYAYDHKAAYENTVNYNIALATDLADAAAQIGTTGTLISDNSPTSYIVPANPGDPEQVRMSRLPRQRMQTMRVRITDFPLNVYDPDNRTEVPWVMLPFGESCAISDITLEYGQKSGVAKIGSKGTV